MAERLIDIEGRDFKTDLVGASSLQLPDIVEAVSLAHDIGHPPFGHAAEVALDDLMKDLGGFEGNAQSFRIVTKIAVRKAKLGGLNLTRATLNGILKYPRYREKKSQSGQDLIPWTERSRGTKWGVYRSEEAEFKHARERLATTPLLVPPNQERWPKDETRSVAAIIMDWADDISYATHDIDDYFRAGLIPLQELRRQDKEREAFLKEAEYALGAKWGDGSTFKRELDRFATVLPLRSYGASRRDKERIGFFTTSQIRYLVCALHSTPNFLNPFIEVDEAAQYRAELLKKMTWIYVIDRPPLAFAQAGQKRIIRELFDILTSMLSEGPSPLEGTKEPLSIPPMLWELYEGIEQEELKSRWWTSADQRIGRAVCDYICTLTEDQTLDVYERLTGLTVSRGSIFGGWL